MSGSINSDEDNVEETLTMIPEVFVYKIPPRTSADSHRASDWDREHHIWSGKLRVTAQGEVALIRLEDKNGGLFAVCKVTIDESPPAYESVVDSSRFFVLKLKDEASKRVAFIGIGFSDRSHAFDFKAALQDHEKYVRQQRELIANPPQYKHVDLSLHEGQTFKLNIKADAPQRPRFESNDSSSGASDDDFTFLPPPPGGKKHAQSFAPTTTTTTQPQQSAQLFTQPTATGGGSLAELSFLTVTTPQQPISSTQQFGGFSSVPMISQTPSVPPTSGFNTFAMTPISTAPTTQTIDPFASLISGTGVRPASPAVSTTTQGGWGDFSSFNSSTPTQPSNNNTFDWSAFK